MALFFGCFVNVLMFAVQSLKKRESYDFNLIYFN